LISNARKALGAGRTVVSTGGNRLVWVIPLKHQ
jgi:hypothetical protein